MRVKMVCVGVEPSKIEDHHFVQFKVQPDGNSEDAHFCKDSPSGDFSLTCRSEKALDEYHKGWSYYLDIAHATTIAKQ